MDHMEQQKGQIALIVILIMTVMLTIGASLASQSITDVSISRQGEAANQTLQAAESGIEQALSKLSTYGGASNTDSATIGNVQTTLKIDRLNVIQTHIDEGGAVTVDLTGSSPNGENVYIDWGLNDTCPAKASLLATVVNNSAGVVTERHYAYGGCSTANGFLTTGNISSGDGYTRRSLSLVTGDTYINIAVLSAPTTLRVQGAGTFTLPYQTYAIRSTATNTQGTENSAIQVNRTILAYPSVFNYVLYSGGTIVQ